MSALAAVWTFFSVPELKGRTLEEVDYMFDNNVALRSMGSYQIEALTHQEDRSPPPEAYLEKQEKGETIHLQHLEK